LSSLDPRVASNKKKKRLKWLTKPPLMIEFEIEDGNDFTTRSWLTPDEHQQKLSLRFTSFPEEDTWSLRDGYAVRTHAVPRKELFSPNGTKFVHQGNEIDGGWSINITHKMMDGPRCTILLETRNGDRTGRVHVCRDDWRTASSKERPPYKEWIGETKFSLDPKPVLRTRGAVPKPLLALVSASARVSSSRSMRSFSFFALST
jgi:hypothetical protein